MKYLKKISKKKYFLPTLIFIVFLLIVIFIGIDFLFNKSIFYKNKEVALNNEAEKKENIKEEIVPLDTVLYDKKMLELANLPPPPGPKTITKKIKDPKTKKITTVIETLPPPIQKPSIWPVKTVYPNTGAILPFKRVVAYYGNLYSKSMGILGEYQEEVVLAKLKDQVGLWEKADPETPVLPALHYIAVVAQGSAGADKKYRFRMPDKEIDKVLAMAEKINGIVFLDIQVALSDLPSELPALEKYLKMPNVHLGIDPEFSMKTGAKPGTVIGTFDASDVNFAAEYLAKLVKENNLPPKILVVHRFTKKMVTNYQNIKPLPEVQIVMDMDGWGGKAKKFGTYKAYISPEPVQFTGFKIFYKSDVKAKGTTILTPEEVLKLSPKPIYIQYQ